MGAFTTEELMGMYKKHKMKNCVHELVDTDVNKEEVDEIYTTSISLPVCEPPPGFEFEDR